MKAPIRPLSLLVGAVALLFAAGAGTAVAKKHKVRTEVVVNPSLYQEFADEPVTYWVIGEVMTSKKKCKKGRTVKVYGDAGGSPLATLSSESDGGFITSPLADVGGSKNAYAVAPKKKKGKTICKKGTSPTVRFVDHGKPYPG
jgi:hypothetical protein